MRTGVTPPTIETDRKGARLGVFSILATTVLWGFSPLYFAMIENADAFEIVCHRVLWSIPILAAFVLWRGRLGDFLAIGRDFRRMFVLVISAALIGVNWVIFVYSIQVGMTQQSSFGYYIYPIFAVVLGAALWGERPTRLQWLSAAIATLGVGWLALRMTEQPYIALAVMATFAAYGAIRKVAAVPPVLAVLWEMVLIAPVAIAYLLLTAAPIFDGPRDAALLMGTAIFTGPTLLLFVEATKRLPYGTVGVLFYINPTLQFVSALILGEAMDVDRGIALVLIWIAVVLYSRELLRRDRVARS